MKKNVLKTFLALIAVFSVIFVGCASEGDDSPSAPKYDEPLGTLYFDCDFCIDNFPMTYKDYLKQYEIVKLKLL